MMENIQSQTLPVWTTFRFTGDSREYFKIWIVNILLTIVTVGLYSPWAKVRTLSYFHGNTWLNDSSFAYLADPVKILKGRLIAVAVLALYWACVNFYPGYSFWALSGLVLLLPFILVMSMAFRMRNTAYRNIRFHFQADYQGAYKLCLIPIGVILVITAILYSLYLASDLPAQMEAAPEMEFHKEDTLFSIFFLIVIPVIPYLDFLRRNFIINQSQYGTAHGSFQASVWEFYKVYLVAFLKSGGLGILISVAMTGIVILFNALGTGIVGFPIAIVMLMSIYFISWGYFKAGITNFTWNHAELGSLRLQSHLSAGNIAGLLLTNTIAIIFSLGLLIPWSKIRMARYVAESTEFLQDRIESINAVAQADRSAIGEEIGDMFDFDFGL